ncbi:MAG: hypothetical protein L6416_03525 [Candidatus Omnitrophica bacterium]|nr:hypothetical protein [Candidatus Omnitrophota bacterium]
MDNKCFCFSKKGILTFVLFSVCIVAIAWASSQLQKVRIQNKEKIVYDSPAEYAKLIAGNFQGIFADAFYIRGILAITDEYEDRAVWQKWVEGNFAAALILDPRLIEAYFFAGIVIARDEAGIDSGIAFLKQYYALNPKQWRIPYWIGFNYLQKGEYLMAAKYYQEAAVLPSAPPFLKSNPAMLYYEAGSPSLGIMYLEGLLNSVNDPKQLEWITIKLEWLKHIMFLEKKVQEFKTVYGVMPRSLTDMLKAGTLRDIPADPFRGGYYFDAQSGRVKSRLIDKSKRGGELR